MKSYAIFAVILTFATSSCKGDKDKAEVEKNDKPEESAPLAKTPVEKPEKLEKADAAVKKAVVPAAPVFADKEYEGTSPYSEEGLSLSIVWQGGTEKLSVCASHKDKESCKPGSADIKKGNKIKFTKEILIVTPRILTAKAEVSYEVGDTKLKAGDKLALYRYEGEGLCDVSISPDKIESSVCPDNDSFDNLPSDNLPSIEDKSTAEQMQPESWLWWVQTSEGWVRFDESKMKLRKKSSM